MNDERHFSREILDSLDGRAAILNGDGEIRSVNGAWIDFEKDGGLGFPATVAVGDNFLDVCRRTEASEPSARRALEGIGSVIDGSAHTFQMQYDRQTSSQKRWFSMTITRLRSGRGALVCHSDITQLRTTQEQLERALAENATLKDQLQAEANHLREEIKGEHNFEEIVGHSGPIQATLRRIEQVAPTDSTVLLLGETGTGKELLARATHAHSRRSARPLIKVDCCNLPPGLIESELFGHEKGAFTGAHERKVGCFELANHGTIFLDEIAELPIELQAKLLRVIEEGTFHRLGSRQERESDARVIAATNRDLEREVSDGRFRADLYYRLGVFPIESPPLRERREDIPLLVSMFVSRFAAALGKQIRSVTSHGMDALVAYDWPGNIRELRNVIERAVILCPGEELTVDEIVGVHAVQGLAAREPSESLKQGLHAVERSTILRALEESGWRIKGAGNAASRLGLSPSTLRSRMARLGIERLAPRAAPRNSRRLEAEGDRSPPIHAQGRRTAPSHGQPSQPRGPAPGHQRD